MTDLLAYARFHMGDGTAANGERVLKRESLELLRTPQLRKQSTDDDIGIGWHLRTVGAIRTASHGGTLGRTHPAARDRAGAQLRDRDSDELERRLARDSGRRARGAEVVPRRDVRARTRRSRTAASSKRCRPSSRWRGSRILRRTSARTARPTNSVVVRADGGQLFVQDRPNTGQPGPEMPVAFFGPDRAVVIDGPDRGQSIEFVRDATGRVNWVRVVGRVAVRTQ